MVQYLFTAFCTFSRRFQSILHLKDPSFFLSSYHFKSQLQSQIVVPNFTIGNNLMSASLKCSSPLQSLREQDTKYILSSSISCFCRMSSLCSLSFLFLSSFSLVLSFLVPFVLFGAFSFPFPSSSFQAVADKEFPQIFFPLLTRKNKSPSMFSLPLHLVIFFFFAGDGGG